MLSAESRANEGKTSCCRAEQSIRDCGLVLTSALMAQHSALVLSRGDIAGQFTERIGSQAERKEACNRTGHTLVCQPSGAFGSVKRRVCFLSSLCVGVGILAQFLARSRDIEHIVRNLKRQSDILSITREIV